MQHNSPNDYVNWLRQQEGQLGMEEAQLAAEEQWLRQKELEHQQQSASRALNKVLQVGLLLGSHYYQKTPHQHQRIWLNRRWNELYTKQRALQGHKVWLQNEKRKYGLP